MANLLISVPSLTISDIQSTSLLGFVMTRVNPERIYPIILPCSDDFIFLRSGGTFQMQDQLRSKSCKIFYR